MCGKLMRTKLITRKPKTVIHIKKEYDMLHVNWIRTKKQRTINVHIPEGCGWVGGWLVVSCIAPYRENLSSVDPNLTVGKRKLQPFVSR